MMKIGIQLYSSQMSQFCQHHVLNESSFSHYTKNYQEVDIYPHHWQSSSIPNWQYLSHAQNVQRYVSFEKQTWNHSSTFKTLQWLCTILRIKISGGPCKPLQHHLTPFSPHSHTPITLAFFQFLKIWSFSVCSSQKASTAWETYLLFSYLPEPSLLSLFHQVCLNILYSDGLP